MKSRVGIPRALLYYKFSVLWITFFEELGVEVVISPETNKKIKDVSVNSAPEEDCYSTKLFFGHTLELADDVDYLFIPRFASDHKLNGGCPKFIALAEVLKSMFPELPEIIMPFFDKAKSGHGKRRIIRIILSIGFKFTRNPIKILRAGKRAFSAYENHRKELLISEEKLKKWENSEVYLNEISSQENGKDRLKIALVGHPYLINDELASLNIRGILQLNNTDLITSEQMPRSLVEKQMEKLDYNMFFDHERELLGTVMHFIESKTVDGILQLIVFCCGPDSLVGEMSSRFSMREPEIPLLQIVLDELTSETGINTRIEAFLDMLERKKTKIRRDKNCQSHGPILVQ